MSYFELLEQFWQLDAERAIAPAASKLYFYLLNEFNTARPVHWPAKLYRRATQVYADLRIDKKTLPNAVAALEERGLIRHYSGDIARSGEWHLNYGPAAEWAEGMGKNSPQDASAYGEKFPTPIPEMAEGMGKNSPPIRNRRRLEEEDKTKKMGGEAAEEITLAPLPAKEKEVSAPRCEAPPKSEAAELPAALAAEAKQLANEIAHAWYLSEIRNQPKWARIHTFVRRLAALGRLEEVRQYFAGYQVAHLRPGVRPHQLDKWLGSPADDYAQGEWHGCEWPAMAAQVLAQPARLLPGQPPPPPAHAAINLNKAAAAQREVIY
jgi:hypothetical protein